MKKLIFVFVALFMLVLISGCGARQNTIRYGNGDDSANIMEATEENSDAKEGEAEENLEKAMTDSGEEKEEVSVPTGKLAITSFDGAFLQTKLSYNVVKGTASSDTHKITVNDYKLTKYTPGQTQWDYIASTKFNTLKNGLNSYVVKTFDKDGNQTDSLIFSINYEAPIIPEALPDVGASHWITLLTTLIIAGSYAIFRKYKWL
jgi:hypothetical protein